MFVGFAIVQVSSLPESQGCCVPVLCLGLSWATLLWSGIEQVRQGRESLGYKCHSCCFPFPNGCWCCCSREVGVSYITSVSATRLSGSVAPLQLGEGVEVTGIDVAAFLLFLLLC